MSFTDYLGKPVSLTTVSGGPTTRYEGIFYTIDIGRQLLALQHVVKKRPGVPDESYPQEFVMFKLTEMLKVNAPEPTPAPAAAPAPAPEPKPEPVPEPVKETPKTVPEEPKTATLSGSRAKLTIQRPSKETETSTAAPTPEEAAPAEAEEEKTSKETVPAQTRESKPRRGGFRGRGGNNRGYRNGYRGYGRRTDAAFSGPKMTADEMDEYDFDGENAEFEKKSEASTDENPEQTMAYRKDDFFDSITSETTQSHRGRSRGGYRGHRGGYNNRNGYYRNNWGAPRNSRGSYDPYSATPAADSKDSKTDAL